MPPRAVENGQAPSGDGRRLALISLGIAGLSLLCSLFTLRLTYSDRKAKEVERLAVECHPGIQLSGGKVQVLSAGTLLRLIRLPVMCDLTNSGERTLSVTGVSIKTVDTTGYTLLPGRSGDAKNDKWGYVPFPVVVEPGKTVRLFFPIGMVVDREIQNLLAREIPRDTLYGVWPLLQLFERAGIDLDMSEYWLHPVGSDSVGDSRHNAKGPLRMTFRTARGLEVAVQFQISEMWDMYWPYN